MARNIFQLFGTVTLEGAEGVKTSLKKIDEGYAKLDKAMGKLGRETVALGTSLTKNITAPIMAAAGAIGFAAIKTGVFADHMLDLKQITGLSTKSLQEYQHVARIAGVNFDGLVNIITKFSNQLPEIRKKSGPTYEAIQRLGISIYDTTGNARDMNDLFPDIIEKLRSVQNVTERNAMAQDIFGRSLADIAPVLGMTRDQFEAAREEAHKLGLVMSEDALNKANNFRIEIEKLKGQLSMLAMNIGMAFMPVFKKDLLPMLQGAAQRIRGVVDWFANLDTSTKKIILTTFGLIAAIGPLLLITGKMILVVKGLVTAFALAKAALIGFHLAMAVNPFAIAIIGATALLGVLTAIKIKQDQIKSNEEKTKELQITAAKIKELKQAVETEKMLGQKVGQARAQAELDAYLIAKGYKKPKTETLVMPGLGSGGEKTEIKENINEEYIQKLIEQGKTELQLLEIRRREAIRIAKEQKVDTIEIELWYDNERQRIIDEQQEKYLAAKDKEVEITKEAEKRKLDEEKAAAEKSLAITTRLKYDSILQAGNKFAEIRFLRNEELKQENLTAEQIFLINKKYDNMLFDAKKELGVKIAQAVGDIISQIASLLQQSTENRIAKLNIERDAEIEAIKRSGLSKAAQQKKIDAINEQAAKKERKLRHDSAVQQKALAIMGAIVNTALAVVGALASLPGIGGIILAAIVGALGIAQIAIIAAQPIPAAKGGLFKSRTGGINAQIAEGGEDELVVPLKSGVKPLAKAILDEIGSMVRPQQPALAFAGSYGGAEGRTTNVNIYAGTIIADDYGVKEFGRRLIPFVTQESQRKGQK